MTEEKHRLIIEIVFMGKQKSILIQMLRTGNFGGHTISILDGDGDAEIGAEQLVARAGDWIKKTLVDNAPSLLTYDKRNKRQKLSQFQNLHGLSLNPISSAKSSP